MSRHTYGRKCPDCGANLDPQERCDCLAQNIHVNAPIYGCCRTCRDMVPVEQLHHKLCPECRARLGTRLEAFLAGHNPEERAYIRELAYTMTKQRADEILDEADAALRQGA